MAEARCDWQVGAAVRERATRERAVRERATRERAVPERATRERAARWLTSRAALSVGCVRAVRVGLKRREGGSACWAAGAGEGEECDAGRAAVAGRAAERKSVRGEEEKEEGSWAVGVLGPG